MPAPERRRRACRTRRWRCETCSDVLALRHAWDVATCGCGALTVSGRPTKPAVHWVSRPGGGFTELSCGTGVRNPAPPRSAPEAPDPGGESPPRRIGFAGPAPRAGGG
ncbi:MAG TPA: hypothetical protein VN796_12650 [Acidimicrobiales bacterium]|nr:hypothetical protein [Acidimicrobiales bacterium]